MTASTTTTKPSNNTKKERKKKKKKKKTIIMSSLALTIGVYFVGVWINEVNGHIKIMFSQEVILE